MKASRAAVYRALLDATAITRWKVPTGMTCHVLSLTYDDPTRAGKTTTQTDTYRGYFVKLVPNEQVIEAVQFETADPALRGQMTITISLVDADGSTDVVAVHEELPARVSTADNERGWREALEKLAAFVEAR